MKPVRTFLTITLFCLSTTLQANDQSIVNFTEIREQAMFAAQKRVLQGFGGKRWRSLRGELEAMRASLPV